MKKKKIREKRINIGGLTVIQQIREPSHRSHRTAHCKGCGDQLDSDFNDTCERCGWLICDCGDCGCN